MLLQKERIESSKDSGHWQAWWGPAMQAFGTYQRPTMVPYFGHVICKSFVNSARALSMCGIEDRLMESAILIETCPFK
eukprot:scaffold227195_cov17-Tisochrysis_lutea.AAC.1